MEVALQTDLALRESHKQRVFSSNRYWCHPRTSKKKGKDEVGKKKQLHKEKARTKIRQWKRQKELPIDLVEVGPALWAMPFIHTGRRHPRQVRGRRGLRPGAGCAKMEALSPRTAAKAAVTGPGGGR